MDFAPGEEFRYNNSAHFLLGYIIEKASGIDYGSYIEKTFFEPLGMTSSSYDRSTLPVKANSRCPNIQALPPSQSFVSGRER